MPEVLEPHNYYKWDTTDSHIRKPAGSPIKNPFKAGDKVEGTEAHDKHFDGSLKGIVEKVDGDYVEVYTTTKNLVELHFNWLQILEGSLLLYYKGKLL